MNIRTNENTAKEVAASSTANESAKYSNTSNSTLILGHLAKPGKSTGEKVVTWGGERLPISEYVNVHIAHSELQNAIRRPSDFKLCAECVAEHDADWHRRQQEKAAKLQREREHAVKVREEKSIIKEITGMDLAREDLVIFMTQARRNGEDFQPFLDALQAIDDLDLQRAGLDSWGDLEDD